MAVDFSGDVRSLRFARKLLEQHIDQNVGDRRAYQHLRTIKGLIRDLRQAPPDAEPTKPAAVKTPVETRAPQQAEKRTPPAPTPAPVTPKPTGPKSNRAGLIDLGNGRPTAAAPAPIRPNERGVYDMTGGGRTASTPSKSVRM